MSSSDESLELDKGAPRRKSLASRYYACVNHRWIRVVSYGIAVTTTSCLYAGWQQYSLILLKGGKYSWVCSPDDEILRNMGFETCAKQEQAVARLFAIATALELLGAIFAGVALDQLGPRCTALIGETIGFGAMIMLVVSRERLNLLPASMFVTGVAINLVAFPALILEDYFPSAAATTAAFVVACQCLSCAIAPVIWELWKFWPHWTFTGIWGVYLVAVWLPASLFYLLTLPRRRGSTRTDLRQSLDTSSHDQVLSIGVATSPPEGQSRKDWESFRRACFSIDFLAMNVVNMILMLQTAYYQVIVRPVSGSHISDFIGWGMPTQALWGLILGRIVDYIKTPAMAMILFIGYAATYCMVQVPGYWLQYGTASIFLFFMSYAFTVKYSFIQERFSTRLFGRLLGVAGALGGISVLLTNLLVGSMTITFWCNTLAGLSILGFLLGGYLLLSSKSLPRAAKVTSLVSCKDGDGMNAPGLANPPNNEWAAYESATTEAPAACS